MTRPEKDMCRLIDILLCSSTGKDENKYSHDTFQNIDKIMLQKLQRDLIENEGDV